VVKTEQKEYALFSDWKYADFIAWFRSVLDWTSLEELAIVVVDRKYEEIEKMSR
jgi:hypothetical protein